MKNMSYLNAIMMNNVEMYDLNDISHMFFFIDENELLHETSLYI